MRIEEGNKGELLSRGSAHSRGSMCELFLAIGIPRKDEEYDLGVAKWTQDRKNYGWPNWSLSIAHLVNCPQSPERLESE